MSTVEEVEKENRVVMEWALTKSFSRVKMGASSRGGLGVASDGDEEGDE